MCALKMMNGYSNIRGDLDNKGTRDSYTICACVSLWPCAWLDMVSCVVAEFECSFIPDSI